MDIIKRLQAVLTPWWNWGPQGVNRLSSLSADFFGESIADVHRFEIQWLGIHFAIELGRTPRRMTDAEEAELRTRVVAFKTKYRKEASL
jgi:hypothetical protein